MIGLRKKNKNTLKITYEKTDKEAAQIIGSVFFSSLIITAKKKKKSESI